MKRFVLILLLASLAACTKPPFLTVTSPASVTVGPEGEVIAVKFSTNRDWVASTATAWTTVESRTGSPGDVTLNVTVSPATYETDDRSVDLILTAEDIEAKVRITQTPPPKVVADYTKYQVECNGGYVEIKLRANVNYTVKIVEGSDWMRTISTKGMESHTAEIAVDPNNSTFPRTGSLQLLGGVAPANVTITQDGQTQCLRVRHHASSFEFPLLGGNNVTGVVDWGDGGPKNNYTGGLSFSYLDIAERTVVFEGKNVSAVTVKSLVDISGLDFSGL